MIAKLDAVMAAGHGPEGVNLEIAVFQRYRRIPDTHGGYTRYYPTASLVSPASRTGWPDEAGLLSGFLTICARRGERREPDLSENRDFLLFGMVNAYGCGK